jgi:hypothetical protein
LPTEILKSLDYAYQSIVTLAPIEENLKSFEDTERYPDHHFALTLIGGDVDLQQVLDENGSRVRGAEVGGLPFCCSCSFSPSCPS